LYPGGAALVGQATRFSSRSAIHTLMTD
jgi:hypothetical protein